MFNPQNHPLASRLAAAKPSLMGSLPPAVTHATLYFCRDAGVMPLASEALSVFSGVPAVLIDVPVADIKAAHMADPLFIKNFGTFDNFHGLFCAQGLPDTKAAEIQASKRWPCIVTAQTAEVVQDSPSRLHAHFRAGHETIPILHYDVNAWWTAHKRWKRACDAVAMMKAAKPAAQLPSHLMCSAR